jgi:hypothetical protein
MQYLNNDIENLLRKAAMHAPVKAKGADWDKVFGQLDQPNEDVVAENKRDFKKYLFIIPLLLASLVCDKFLQLRLDNGHGQKQHSFNTVSEQKAFEEIDEKGNKIANGEIATVKRENKKFSSRLIDNTVFVFTPQISKSEKEKHTVTENKNSEQKEEVVVSESKISSTTSQNEFKNQTASVNKEQVATSEQAQKAFENVADENKNEAVAAIENKQKAKKQKAKSKFYLTALVAPDVSTIKFQKIDAMGYGGGLKAGYNISKKWAVETGVLWQHKEYYTKGEHFKTNKIYLPQNVKIINANGYCEMFEIPVDVRYNYKQTAKNNWFALAGLSTYLMQEEDYVYLMERNGQQYEYNKYYTKPSQYWFSIVNISAGYEHKVGGFGSMRIEPYLKLPLKGMGVGSLPFTSAGVNFGFTHTF